MGEAVARVYPGPNAEEMATKMAAALSSPATPEPALAGMDAVTRDKIKAFCVERRQKCFPGGWKTIDGAALIGAFDWGVLTVFDALAALSPAPAPDQKEGE